MGEGSWFRQHLPANSLAISIAVEPQNRNKLTAVQAIDHVVQPLLGRHLGLHRQVIVDVRRPALLLKSRKNQFLIPGWHAVLLEKYPHIRSARVRSSQHV